MAAHVPPSLADERGGGRIPLERLGRDESRQRQAALVEQARDPPQACPAAIFVHALRSEVSVALGDTRRTDFRQRLLRPAVAVAHRILGAFLDVENEIQRQTRAAGPIGMRRFGAVADEVPVEVVR